MLSWVASRGAQVDGLAWQIHTDVNAVLNANFPLAQRMQDISAMGPDNYVTELDIPIPQNSAYWLERQKEAYNKGGYYFYGQRHTRQVRPNLGTDW